MTLFTVIIFRANLRAQLLPGETSYSDTGKATITNSANAHFSYKIIDAPNHTFGYDVFANNKLIIHQDVIPAISGNNGFKSKMDAEKIAILVIEKIRKGEMPPTVTVDEMRKLRVIS